MRRSSAAHTGALQHACAWHPNSSSASSSFRCRATPNRTSSTSTSTSTSSSRSRSSSSSCFSGAAARSAVGVVWRDRGRRSRRDHTSADQNNCASSLRSPILVSCFVRRCCGIRSASSTASCCCGCCCSSSCSSGVSVCDSASISAALRGRRHVNLNFDSALASSASVRGHRHLSLNFDSALASSASVRGHRAVNVNFDSSLASPASVRGHRALNSDEGGQHGRGLLSGSSLLMTGRNVNKFASSEFACCSGRRPWLDGASSGQRGRLLQQGFCHGRAELAVMAASEGVLEGYRPNVGLCLVNDKDEVFVASRLDIPDSWQMPQGGVDDGEDPRNAAFRELREETGVTTVQHIGEVPDWLTYDFPPDVKAKISTLWGTEWKGQAQKWFLFRFTGDESEITLAGDGSEKPEFGDWKWLPAEQVLNLVVAFKRPVYAQVFKALAVHVDAWSKL